VSRTHADRVGAPNRPSACRRGYDRHWQRVAAAAIANQPYCTNCGSQSDLTGDHVIPVSRGGLSTRANCQVLCRPCNARKRNLPSFHRQLSLDALVRQELTR
jgi:5-methylcytosine-specific restriction endonuclease McrA